MTPDAALVSELDVLVVSFNTRDLLRQSLQSIEAACQGLKHHRLIVVDNASHDGSADMVAQEFPNVTLLRAPHNLGFAAANNLGWQSSQAEWVALVNPDAFLEPCSLCMAVQRMRQQPPDVALAGGLLIGKNGLPEPSARLFPSVLNDFLALSGLSSKYPRSRFFGRFDRTWADAQQAADVDWVPGALSIIRRSALEHTGFFDERFFLYYEEVDLCHRLKQQGHRIVYWPDLKATHWGGESSKTVGGQTLSSSGRQLTLWRMRSQLLYYRKHHGWFTAWIAARVEIVWHQLRRWRNGPHSEKGQASTAVIAQMRRAWQDTLGGRVSPPRPW